MFNYADDTSSLCIYKDYDCAYNDLLSATSPMKTSQNEIVITCYCNAVRNANTPIGHNIAFLRNTLGIDIDNNEITPDISLPKVYLTNEQRVLLSNL